MTTQYETLSLYLYETQNNQIHAPPIVLAASGHKKKKTILFVLTKSRTLFLNKCAIGLVLMKNYNIIHFLRTDCGVGIQDFFLKKYGTIFFGKHLICNIKIYNIYVKHKQYVKIKYYFKLTFFNILYEILITKL